jgi:phage-related protein
MPWPVVYYRAADGSEPVDAYIDDLDERIQAAIDNQVMRLAVFGPRLPFPHSSQVRGELRELRCHYGSSLYRILYRRSANLFVLLRMFRKATEAIPDWEIEIAARRWEDFRDRSSSSRTRASDDAIGAAARVDPDGWSRSPTSMVRWFGRTDARVFRRSSGHSTILAMDIYEVVASGLIGAIAGGVVAELRARAAERREEGRTLEAERRAEQHKIAWETRSLQLQAIEQTIRQYPVMWQSIWARAERDEAALERLRWGEDVFPDATIWLLGEPDLIRRELELQAKYADHVARTPAEIEELAEQRAAVMTALDEQRERVRAGETPLIAPEQVRRSMERDYKRQLVQRDIGSRGGFVFGSLDR